MECGYISHAKGLLWAHRQLKGKFTRKLTTAKFNMMDELILHNIVVFELFFFLNTFYLQTKFYKHFHCFEYCIINANLINRWIRVECFLILSVHRSDGRTVGRFGKILTIISLLLFVTNTKYYCTFWGKNLSFKKSEAFEKNENISEYICSCNVRYLRDIFCDSQYCKIILFVLRKDFEVEK